MLPIKKGGSDFSQVLASMDDHVVFTPEYNPQAVADYCLYGTQGGRRKDQDLILKVKKHLAAMGWTFQYKWKTDKRRELRYGSPTGRMYMSLITACQRVVDGDDGGSGSTKKRRGTEGVRAKKRNRVQKVEAFCSYGGNEVKDQDQLVSSNDLGSVNFWIEEVRDDEKKAEFSDDRPKKRLRKAKSSGFYREKEEEEEEEDDDDDEERSDEPKKRKKISKRKKRVRKKEKSPSQPRGVPALLVQRGVVLPGARVVYRNKDGRSMAQGRIYCDGIQCDCCGQKFLLTKFEAHAGSTYHRPAAYIFLDDGRSLFDCQAQLNCNNKGGFKTVKSTKTSESPSPLINDDICSVCWDGGDLILCDSCPFSFHPTCIGLDAFPSSEHWFCPSCCCGICGQGQLSKSDLEDSSRDQDNVKCVQCEHQFHIGCLQKNGNSTYICNFFKGFCSEKCENIFAGIQRISGKSIQLAENNLSWSLLKLDPNGIDNDVFTETCSKLNIALEVMHDCFEPVIHAWTNSDVVGDVIFSRSSAVKRSNFRGFFTVVLERDEEVITVATVRVHGGKVAEIPLVATRRRYRRLGMCRFLMDKLEQQLTELGVERLVLPAIPDVVNTWTGSFGFSVMTEPERLSLLTCAFLDFPGTIKCQKILKQR